MKHFLFSIIFLFAFISTQAQRTTVVRADEVYANESITLNGEKRTKWVQFYNQAGTPGGVLHESDLWYNTSNSTFYVYDGSAWVATTTAVQDGDKGDITVSASGTVWTIDAGVVTPSMLDRSYIEHSGTVNQTLRHNGTTFEPTSKLRIQTDRLIFENADHGVRIKDGELSLESAADADTLTIRATKLNLHKLNSRTTQPANTAILNVGANTDGSQLVKFRSNTGDGYISASQKDINSVDLQVVANNVLVHDLQVDGDAVHTGKVTAAGFDATGQNVENIAPEAYGIGWDGDNSAPTKNDVYDKMEAVIGGAADGVATAGTWDDVNNEIDVTVNGSADFSIDLQAVMDSINAGSGAADSSIFSTNFRRDTALSNVRGEIAGIYNSGAGYLPRFDGTGFINSVLYGTGTTVGLGTNSPTARLEVSSSNIAGLNKALRVYNVFTDAAATGTNVLSNTDLFGYYRYTGGSNYYRHFNSNSTTDGTSTFAEYTNINISHTIANSGTSGTANGMYFVISKTGSATVSAINGMQFLINPSTGANTYARGQVVSINKPTTGSVTYGEGVIANVHAGGASTTVFGGTSTSSATNLYGLKLDFPSSTAGTRWGAYITNADKNYFQNSTGIGTTTPSELLHVAGNIKATGHTITTAITDADTDTKVHVEKSTDEDIIRFDIAGTEKMKLDATSLTAHGRNLTKDTVYLTTLVVSNFAEISQTGDFPYSITIPAELSGYSFSKATWSCFTPGVTGSSTFKIQEYTPTRTLGTLFGDATFSSGDVFESSTTGTYSPTEGDLLVPTCTAEGMTTNMEGLSVTLMFTK